MNDELEHFDTKKYATTKAFNGQTYELVPGEKMSASQTSNLISRYLWRDNDSLQDNNGKRKLEPHTETKKEPRVQISDY